MVPQRALALLLGALLAVPPMALADAAPEGLEPLRGTLVPFLDLTRDVGPADPARSLHLVIVLRLVEEGALTALADRSDARWLSHEEIIARHAPAEATVDAVVAGLATRGLTVSRISADRTLLSVDTTVAEASAAFAMPLRLYRVGEGTLMGHPTPPQVPVGIAPSIQAIVGLTEAPLWTLDALASNGTVPYGPADLRAAYDVDAVLSAGYDGAGRVLAITSWGSADAASLDAYSDAYALPAATLSQHNATGGADCGGGDLEWDLDVQIQHALAPGASLRVYCGESATLGGMFEALGRLVEDNVADVVSQSWGTCEKLIEPATAAAWESKLTQAAAQGQAVFTASGDTGSRDCSRADPTDTTVSASWPGTAPHTTSVGGTNLALAGSAYAGESAWSGSGGAPSLRYAVPDWQRAPEGATMRASPDVSAVADPATGVRIRSSGLWFQVGGTSVAAPVVAGMWTDLVQQHGRMGHASLRLWALGGDASVLRDITNGSNGDFSAGAGYDFPSGLGSLRLAGLSSALSFPSAPPSFRALAGPGPGAAQLSWELASGGATSYRVYAGNAPGVLSLLTTTGALTFTETNLTPAVARYYQVSALGTEGEGPRSPERLVRPWAAARPPLSLDASHPVGMTAVRVTWGAPTNVAAAGITGYRLYRDGILLDTLQSPFSTSFVDETCALAVTCSYHATSIGAAGDSVPSNVDREIGLSVGIARAGSPSDDPAGAARLIGRERLVLQMDADDVDAPLQGLTRDSSPMQDHAKVAGPALASGRFGQGLHFATGDAPLVLMEDVITSNLASGTIMMWVDLAQPGTLFQKDFLDGNAPLLFQVDAEGRLIFRLTSGGQLTSAPGAVTTGAWTHVAVTWGPEGKRLYVDGARVASDNVPSQVGTRSNATRVGVGLVGTLDEVRLYDAALPAGLLADLASRPYLRTS